MLAGSASLTTSTISRIIEEGYDADRLNTHFDELLKVLNLDYLFIDTHPGLNKETLLDNSDIRCSDNSDTSGSAGLLWLCSHFRSGKQTEILIFT